MYFLLLHNVTEQSALCRREQPKPTIGQDTPIWAITVAVQCTKIMYCPTVCTFLMYVLSRHMYRPYVCTVRAYVLSGCMYRPDVCTVWAHNVPSRLMDRPDVCRVSGCNRLTRQETKFSRTGSPLLCLPSRS